MFDVRPSVFFESEIVNAAKKIARVAPVAHASVGGKNRY